MHLGYWIKAILSVRIRLESGSRAYTKGQPKAELDADNWVSVRYLVLSEQYVLARSQRSCVRFGRLMLAARHTRTDAHE